MTLPLPAPALDRDPVLIHQYIRLFGHVPTAAELDRYRRARTRVSLRLPGRARRGTARLIARW